MTAIQKFKLDKRIATHTEKPPDYKQTELGAIPVDWEICPLSYVADVHMGQSPPGRSYNNVGDGSPLINGPTEFTEKYPAAVQWTTEPTKFSRTGDVLLCVRGSSTGRLNIADGDYCIGRGVAAIRSRPGQSPSFLAYLVADAVRRLLSLTTGSTFPNLDRKTIEAIPVVDPPEAEQRAIGQALQDTDVLIESLDRLIAKKLAVRLAAMQQLLTGRQKLPGFNNEWPLIKLGSVLKFLKHGSNPRADLGSTGSVHYLHYGDVHAHDAPILDCDQTTLPLIEELKVANLPRLCDGDLILVDASEDIVGIGKSVELQNVKHRAFVGGLHTIVTRGENDQWAPGFKAYLQYIPEFKRSLEKAASGISVYAISKRNVSEISIHLPSKEEQNAIVQVLSDMDNDLFAVRNYWKKMIEVKQGMMQSLLMGNVRLIQQEVNA